MKPMYFGPGQRLFGISYSPHPDRCRRAGVVLCYPYGQDYLYAYRSFRTLATRLAGDGFSVLRFDYVGTGDSAGEVEDASVLQWISDTADSVERVRSEGLNSISLVGFRLGASLAATAAGRCGKVNCLVLWEPVVDGAEYVSALKARHHSWFGEHVRLFPQSRQLGSPEDLLGSRLTETLAEGVKHVNLLSMSSCPARNVLIIDTEGARAHIDVAERLRKLGSVVEIKKAEDHRLSSMVPGKPLGLVPYRVLTEIAQWLGRAAHA